MAYSYVYSTTPSSLQYALMQNPTQPANVAIGSPLNCPEEYEPIVLSVQENLDDIFIEPSIQATYFAMVDLQIGGFWVITDPASKAIYECQVATKQVDRKSGTVSYTFATLMRRLARHEPAGVVISALDAGLGQTGTPNEVLSYLVNRWAAEVRGLQLMGNAPNIVLRGDSGDIMPYVLFLSVQQQVGQSLSILEWLKRFFDVFDGYAYRLNGRTLNVLPPMYQQTEGVDLSGALVLSETVTASDESVVNSQTVSHRPYVFSGEFAKNDNGTPKSPSDLPTIAEPVFYRQGDTDLVALPDNRRLLLNGQYAAYIYSEDLYPVTPPVRVVWTAFVFQSVVLGDGSTQLFDVSEGNITMQTHVVDLGFGRFFDAVTNWTGDSVEGGVSSGGATWVWRLSLDKRGVKATLIVPAGNPTYTGTRGDESPFRPNHPYTMGAEFHMDILGAAWEKSKVSYTATYGVYTPPTLPPGVEVPPIEVQSDAATDATEPIYGRRPGADKVIDIWSLVSQPATTSAELSDADKQANETALRELVSRTLLDIAQNSVKQNLLPYEEVTLELMRPFPVTAANLGQLAQYGDRTGLIRAYSLSEQNTLRGQDVGLELVLRVPQTAERQPITFVPITPDDGEAYIPPGYPADGDFPGEPPVVPEPISAGPGMVQLDMGRRFDLLRLEGAQQTRIRLYRTDAARAADQSRSLGMLPNPEIMPLLILEATLEAPDFDLDLHSILGHTPQGVVYVNIVGGSVTFRRYLPKGGFA